MKYALIQRNPFNETQEIAWEIIDFSPVGRYHPSLEWKECDEVVKPNWVYNREFDTFSEG